MKRGFTLYIREYIYHRQGVSKAQLLARIRSCREINWSFWIKLHKDHIEDVVLNLPHLHGFSYKMRGDRVQFSVGVLLALVSVLAASVTATKCSIGSFTDPDSGECVKCSACPINQIVRRPCGNWQDTVCGPFYEFRQFGQREFALAQPQQQQHAEDGRARPQEAPSRAQHAGNTHTAVTVDSPVEVAEEAEQWRELMFTLLGVIGGVALLVLAAFIYLLVTHYRSRNHKTNAAYVEDPEGGPFIYTRARLFSRDRLSTTDYRENLAHLERQLAQNKLRNHIVSNLYSKNPQQMALLHCSPLGTEADDVFHHDARIPTSTPLSAIPERRESEAEAGIRTEDSPAVFSPSTEEELTPLSVVSQDNGHSPAQV